MMTQQSIEIQDTIETRYQVHPADIDCYGGYVTQEIQYLTDPRVEPGKPSYRLYADLYHKYSNARLLADVVTTVPSRTALNRIVRQSSLGSDWVVLRQWCPEPESSEPF